MPNARHSGSRSRRSTASVSGSVYSAASVSAPTTASIQKMSRHCPTAMIRPPTLGPSIGARAVTIISVDIICAARRPTYRSRTMARARVTLAQAPMACTARHAIIPSTPCDVAQPTEPRMYSTIPMAIGRRRPMRSLNGPQKNCPRLKPIR